MWTLDELRAVTDTAHDLDTPCLAHCRNATSTRLAAEAGVDLILHASFLDEAALAAVVEAGCAIAPTFTFLANLADHGDKVGAMGTQVDLFRGEIEATATMLRAAHDAGVPILAGSESGFALTPYGHWHAREMEVLVDAMGLTPLEAIRCATSQRRRGAAHGGGHDRGHRSGRGGRRAGRRRRPVTDVTVLGDRSNLRHVISRGRPVDLRSAVAHAAPAAGGEGRPVGHRPAHVGGRSPMTGTVVVTGAGHGRGRAPRPRRVRRRMGGRRARPRRGRRDRGRRRPRRRARWP